MLFLGIWAVLMGLLVLCGAASVTAWEPSFTKLVALVAAVFTGAGVFGAGGAMILTGIFDRR